MSVLPFRAVEFSRDDPIEKDELDILSSNLQWVNDNTPRGKFYRTQAKDKTNQLVILSGREQVTKNAKDDTAVVKVKFPKAFHPQCHPHITTAVVCDFSKKVFCTVSGEGTAKLPDASGFVIKVNVYEKQKKKDNIGSQMWVHWHAFGYRTDDMNEF